MDGFRKHTQFWHVATHQPDARTWEV